MHRLYSDNFCAHHRAVWDLCDLAGDVDNNQVQRLHRAASRHRSCWADLPYAVIDCEATGPDPDVDRLLEVAVVHVGDDGLIQRTWCTLVNPGGTDSTGSVGAVEVHGITAADLGAAPGFAAVADRLERLLEGRIVVGHRVAFDAALLAAEARRVGRFWRDPPAVCTWRASRGLDMPSRLADIASQFGFVHRPRHRALPDALAAAELCGRLLWQARDAGLLMFVPEFGCDTASERVR